MVLSAGEQERSERSLKRMVFRRDKSAAQIKILYDLSLKIGKESDLIPLFRARKKDIEVHISDFRTEQTAIMDELLLLGRDREYSETHLNIENTVEEQYYFILAVAGSTDNIDPISSDFSVTNRSHIQLPKIKIPSFDGDLLRWCSFRDTFLSIVHNNTNLSNIERFHYLLSAISGNASTVVRSVPLSEANYEVAWNALIERYDNQRLLINAHLEKLFNFSPLTSSSLGGLKRFLDVFQENISAINAFNIPDRSGFLLFYIASRVLDSSTKCLFESEFKDNSLPVVDDLLKFVQARCKNLQNSSHTPPLDVRVNVNKPSKSSAKVMSFSRTSLLTTEQNQSCPHCQNIHFVYQCEKFKQLPVVQRLKIVQSRRMCTNCLSTSHTSSKCMSKYTCRVCSGKHHSLLHLGKDKEKISSTTLSNSNSSSSLATSSSPSPSDNSTTALLSTANNKGNNINSNVLGTALIRVCDKFGQWVPIRALIDSGSQISAVTHTCANRLGLTRRNSNVTVVGLSQSSVTQTKGVTTCTFVPYTSKCPKLTCEPLILSKITGPMPPVPLNPNIRSIYKDLNFADPSFDHPGRIEFLLGADLYNQIFENGYQVRHTPGHPSAFETTLGWIFVGTSTQLTSSVQPVVLTLLSEPSIKQLLTRFWEINEPVVVSAPFTEEQKCEDMFSVTTTRDRTGRYTVAFPFKVDPPTLGDSRVMALSRFFNLERKLRNEPDLYREYRTFMNEYVKLGHMKIATHPGKYIIPHHAVVKHDNNKIKLRVVFDASARTSSGSSLNDMLFVGSKLQCDIMDLLICCRLHRYMFTADICKMYRQINIAPSHRIYQHILWRDDPSKPLKEYELSTVTYGVASSPFQALRVLHQLETDEGDKYPAAKGVFSSQTYVDDIITGGQTIDNVTDLQRQIIQLLAQGGFELRKWVSNCPEILQNIPKEHQSIELSFDPKDDCSVKILGLHWDPSLDVFTYHSEPFTSTPTKRSILSAIAKIFDPLGVLAPITFWAKCFMQALWKDSYEWDQPISGELSSSWKFFASQLPCVASIRLNRYIPLKQSSHAQLIGFSDASIKGYASVVYIRLQYRDKPTTVHLVTAKSKVAPLKSGQFDDTLSVPRLELCGALLLAQTLHRVQQTLFRIFNIEEVHAWTDSTIVLSWLTTPQIHFKIFVTNRLSKISELIPNCQWHYIPTSKNPADCVSRGMFPNEVLSHHLYWNGPEFLKEPIDQWSTTRFNAVPLDQMPERTSNLVSVHVTTTHHIDTQWLERFSSFTRLQRSVVYLRRFVAHIKKESAYSGFIRYTELNDALQVLVRITQMQDFSELFKVLSSNTGSVTPRALACLMPFLDTQGIIRVGGRLRNSDVQADFKYPILLSKSCYLSTLLVRHYHIQKFHAGPQLVASLLSARFWILSSRSLIRRIIFNCVVCTRHRASSVQPVMGDLPSARVCPSRPFSNVGIDYAGPLLIKEGKRRNARSTKCYLAIFVCMAVKAVHIEVVSDLSTAAFLAALHRFVARRGVPSHIYSDCGTNFKGADSVLRGFFADPIAQNVYSNAVPCQWHFNPPAAPHFGGLWEAAVKSTKFHLKRVIGSQIFTFEEMSTLTNRIEAVLNSRPIMPHSMDPNDLRALTPGDFLIGCPLVAIPEPNHTDTKINCLTRWQLISQMHQSFWKRWSSEYLTTLQGRSKWYRKQTGLSTGDLVLVHSPNVPPTCWNLGRVELTHAGEDGVVRVVTVRTRDGVYKRPVVKLAVLPVTDDPIS